MSRQVVQKETENLELIHLKDVKKGDTIYQRNPCGYYQLKACENSKESEIELGGKICKQYSVDVEVLADDCLYLTSNLLVTEGYEYYGSTLYKDKVVE